MNHEQKQLSKCLIRAKSDLALGDKVRVDKTNESGILVTLDQEKVFDHVDHSFLMRTLLKFGLCPSFCKWVSLFYNNVFSRIIVNGNLLAPVFLERGVRQACPLSPLLYVLVSEVSGCFFCFWYFGCL